MVDCNSAPMVDTLSGSELQIGRVPSEDALAAAEEYLSQSKATNTSQVIADLVKLDPQVLAATLLSQMASTNESSNLFQAVEYVKAGIIQHRARHQGICFCNIHLPDEVFIHVLGFLDKRDLIDSVSRVSVAWAKASLSPAVTRWQTIAWYPTFLDEAADAATSSGSEACLHSNITTKKLLLEMLQRPQFDLLKKLIIPRQVLDNLNKKRPSSQESLLPEDFLEEIAAICPHVEEIRPSWGDFSFSAETLLKLPVLLPKLNSVNLEMTDTRPVMELVQRFGKRLVALEVHAHDDLETGFTNDDLVLIGKHCPNLRTFYYSSFQKKPYIHSVVTRAGLAALVQGCDKMENLGMIRTCRRFELEEFEYLAANAKCLRFLDVPYTWLCRDNDKVIGDCFGDRLQDKDYNDDHQLFKYRLKPLPR